MTTTGGEEGECVIELDKAGWSVMSPAVYMLSQSEEFDLKERLATTAYLCLLCGEWSRAAVRTLSLGCVVPVATHTQTDGTMMIIMGVSNWRTRF